jgi:shikimate kinase
MANAHNIVLAGFMGTGKTTVGQIVAERLRMHYLDTDAEIEARAGRSIASIFEEGGEASFRGIEQMVCLDAAAGSDQVIATGGGALLNERTRSALEATSLIVCLRAELYEIILRVGEDPSRPLFSAESIQLRRLYHKRLPLYNSLPHQVDTMEKTAEEVAEEVIELWNKNS